MASEFYSGQLIFMSNLVKKVKLHHCPTNRFNIASLLVYLSLLNLLQLCHEVNRLTNYLCVYPAMSETLFERSIS